MKHTYELGLREPDSWILAPAPILPRSTEVVKMDVFTGFRRGKTIENQRTRALYPRRQPPGAIHAAGAAG